MRCIALLLILAASGVQAQDIELAARGRTLPAGYYARIALQPDFFEGTAGWRLRTLQSAATGKLPVAVIQVLFADSPEPHIDAAEIRRVLFDGPAPFGTLTEYYREVSGNRLNVTGQVSPWVRTEIDRATTVGTSMGLGGDAQVGTFVVQALRAADEFIDFRQFDNDGPDGVPNSGDDDGFADAVAFQYIERAASCGGNGIWPHRSRVQNWGAQTGGPFVTSDLRPNGTPVRVNDYIVQSTVDCAGGTQTASVIAHELGHVLGLPDLYHAANGITPPQRRWVLGCWTLMAAGAWGCGDGSTFGSAPRPPHMGPWEKAQLGWVQEDIIGNVRDQEYVLAPVQTSGRMLRVPLNGDEYFQMEYRPRIGFDDALPVSGVLIYHIEPNRSLYPSVNGPRLYRVSLEEADGDSALLRTSQEGGNRGVASDAWAVNGPARMTNLTNPSTRRNSGLPSTVTIHSITIEEGSARVRLSTHPSPAFLTVPRDALALAPYHAALPIAGGALPYLVSLDGAAPAGMTISASQDTIHLSGTPLESGALAFSVRVVDALGTIVSLPLTLSVAPVALPSERLLQPFLHSAATPLTTQESSYLDASGNRNGRYDVGDLRRQLRRTGPAN